MRTEPEPRDEEHLYEIAAGEWVKLPPRSVVSAILASRLGCCLARFANSKALGEAATPMLFHLPLPHDCCRRPDVAFVSCERWPRTRPMAHDDNAWDIVPNLAAEVVSPSEPMAFLAERIAEYFQAGVQLVWVIYPSQRLVYVYQSLTQVHGLTRADTLDGGTVLPGFQLPLREVFLEEPSAS